LRVAVHSVGTFQTSTTRAAAQGGIGCGSDLSDALTVRCRIPRKLSIAENLNSPKSAIAINPGNSALRNRTNDPRTKWRFVTQHLGPLATEVALGTAEGRAQMTALRTGLMEVLTSETELSAAPVATFFDGDAETIIAKPEPVMQGRAQSVDR
jgi:hypothetical protein